VKTLSVYKYKNKTSIWTYKNTLKLMSPHTIQYDFQQSSYKNCHKPKIPIGNSVSLLSAAVKKAAE